MEQLTDRDLAPAWFDALDLLNRDLAATEPDAEPFALLLTDVGVYVGFPSWGAQGSALPDEADLFEVADAAQDSAMEHLWRVWPVCPEHRSQGLHARYRAEDGSTVWSCRGTGPDAGHDYPVGTLKARQQGSRRASKRQKRQISQIKRDRLR